MLESCLNSHVDKHNWLQFIIDNFDQFLVTFLAELQLGSFPLSQHSPDHSFSIYFFEKT